MRKIDKKNYVTVNIKEPLKLDDVICFNVYYDVTPNHQMSKEISLYTETRYVDIS